jgi:magnesium transporter
LAWYLFTHPDNPALDELANRLQLHPLHMEDVRSPGERVKVEGSGTYTFALLKTLTLPEQSEQPVLETISIFASHAQMPTGQPAAGSQPAQVGSQAQHVEQAQQVEQTQHVEQTQQIEQTQQVGQEQQVKQAQQPWSQAPTTESQTSQAARKALVGQQTQPLPHAGEPFFIVVADTSKRQVAEALRRAEQECDNALPARLLYLVFDSIVDSYFPAIDALDDEIDALQDKVVRPSSDMLSNIFAVKSNLVDIRRLLVSTRDASMHLQRDSGIALNSEHQLYLRDLYDHISRLLDTVETQRDLLTNALDIYLSSIANRTNEVMKVLTVLSTIALPALVVTGVYGMNVKGLPFVNSPYAAELVGGLTLSLTGLLLGFLRWLRWL